MSRPSTAPLLTRSLSCSYSFQWWQSFRAEGGSAPVRATHPAPMRSSSRIRCTHALNERQVREGLGKFPRCQPVYGSISWAYSSSGLAEAGRFSHSALGRGSPPDLGERRDQP
jgi:hypothetical protein